MIDTAPTVSGLVARFQLRRRATSDVFASGVRLARLGAVTLESVSAEALRASVRNPEPMTVEIMVVDGGLVGRCSCAPDGPDVCRHQVAAAHALWVGDRRLRRLNR